MKNLVIVTKSDQANGYRLAGIRAIGVNEVNDIEPLVESWLANKDEILLAMDDSLFSMLNKHLIERIYQSNDMVLVTIPDGPVSVGEGTRIKRVHEMIRHATGAQIRFKGEFDGKK